jgi:two-component system NtrC family response regulator
MNILIADDEKGIRKGISHLFQREGNTVFEAADFDEALVHVQEQDIEIALLDIRLGDRDGVELLSRILELDPEILCFIITGYGSIRSAVEAMQSGAADYLLKPLDNEKLLQTVESRMELKKLKEENDFLRAELVSLRDDAEFIHSGSAMERILNVADRVKDTDATVLITGESGTGKEVLCRYIHDTGTRREAPFVGVNCAALSETLLLSELFGHEKGAFTGASERKPGKFELACGGTLFLDEIGDMSLEAQAKLLRVIEESAFERVGGTSLIKTDIRLIAATNQDLKALIREKKFREDLYYRLNVICLALPPLREREEDLEALCDYFCQYFARRYKKAVPSVSKGSLTVMRHHSWPGNIRELRNMLNQAVLLSDGGELDLSTFLIPAEKDLRVTPGQNTGGSLQEQMNSAMEVYERSLIEQALVKSKYNRTAAADALGITRKTLFNKISKYSL